MSRSAKAAHDYARMSDVERCAFAGKLLRNTWYARVLQPERVESLLEQGYPVARLQQIPSWMLGNESVRTQVFMGGRGSGKDLAIDTPILTANRGWQTMGSIQIGDIVFDENGEQCNVRWKSDPTTEKDMYRISFSEGEDIVASDTHEWMTRTIYEKQSGSSGKVRTTTEILSKIKKGKNNNHSIRICYPLNTDDIELPLSPYDLGIWLGDGNSDGRNICFNDRDRAEISEGMSHLEIGWSYELDYAKANLQRLTMEAWRSIRTLGLFKNKHVPELYLRSGLKQRRLLLAGLIDSDGSVRETSKCKIVFHNEKLSIGVLELAISLGLKATLSINPSGYISKRDGSTKNSCEIRFIITEEHKIPIRSSFKRRNIRESYRRSSSQNRMITSIVRTANVPCQCICVDSPSHLYLAGKSLIATHNTRCATGFIAPEILERPNTRAGILSVDFKVSVGVGIKGRSGIKTIIESFDPTLITKFDEVKNILYLVNGSRVMCYSSEYPRSIEGEEFHLYWVDEVAEVMGAGGDQCIWRKRAEPGIRLIGDKNEPIRKIITGTPEATELIIDLHESTEKYPAAYSWSQLATRDNIENLDEVMVEQMYDQADENSDFYRAKLEGELILESPNALLSETDFSTIRVSVGEDRFLHPEQMDIVAMAVDASHADDKKSDECGIIIGGKKDRHAYVFADASMRGGPKAWGERIIEGLIAFPEIDQIAVEDDKSLVIEVVERVLRDELRRIGRPVKVIPMPHQNKSKKVRAEPVAVEYQLKHVLHAPSQRRPGWGLQRYEQQWKSWNPKTAKKSPDRVDAGVYLVTFLLLRGYRRDEAFSPSAVAGWK